MNEFFVHGIKVEITPNGIKIFTTNQNTSKVIWSYLKHEGFLENENNFELVGLKNN